MGSSDRHSDCGYMRRSIVLACAVLLFSHVPVYCSPLTALPHRQVSTLHDTRQLERRFPLPRATAVIQSTVICSFPYACSLAYSSQTLHTISWLRLPLVSLRLIMLSVHERTNHQTGSPCHDLHPCLIKKRLACLSAC
jgi:hypothetical protein